MPAIPGSSLVKRCVVLIIGIPNDFGVATDVERFATGILLVEGDNRIIFVAPKTLTAICTKGDAFTDEDTRAAICKFW